MSAYTAVLCFSLLTIHYLCGRPSLQIRALMSLLIGLMSVGNCSAFDGAASADLQDIAKRWGITAHTLNADIPRSETNSAKNPRAEGVATVYEVRREEWVRYRDAYRDKEHSLTDLQFREWWEAVRADVMRKYGGQRVISARSCC